MTTNSNILYIICLYYLIENLFTLHIMLDSDQSSNSKFQII